MLAPALRRNRTSTLLLVALALAGLLAVGVIRAGLGSSSDDGNAQPSALLTIDGTDYAFTPTTCFVGDDTFVAAGPSGGGSDQYVVAASPSLVEIIFGVSDEAEPIEADTRWYATVEPVDWRLLGNGVSTRVDLHERGDAETPAQRADLVIQCGSPD